MRRVAFRWIAGSLATLFVASCGGGEPTALPTPTPPPPPPPPVLTSLAVTLSSASLITGGTATATASGLDQNGAAIATGAVSWASSASAVASVSPNGVVTGVSAGTTQIIASAGGKQAAATMTVTLPPVTSLAISPSRDSVVIDAWGDTAALAASVRSQNGTVVPNASVRFQSLDASIATVSASGQIVSVKVGATKVRITASLPGVPDATVDITVRVALQRNAACRVPMTMVRGATQGVPAYGSNVIFLPGITATTWPGSRSLGVDWDGDGDTDVLRLEYMFPSSPGPYLAGVTRLFQNNGGSFSDVTTSSLVNTGGPDHQRDFEIRDFTGDGIADVYVAVHGFDASPFPGARNLFFSKVGSSLVESAASTFTPYQRNGFTHGSTSGDVDCDGDADIIEIQANDNVPSNLFLNNGTGRFTLAASSAFPPASGVQRFQEGELIDFDNDGDPDLYMGCKSSTVCTGDVLYVNDGFGRFRVARTPALPAPRYTPVHALNQVKSADFNGDGWPDLFTFEIDRPFTTTSAIRLLINQKDGSFIDQSTAWGLPASCSAEMIEPLYIRDMNNDGWPDVLLPRGCPELGQSGGVLFNRGSSFSYFAFTNIQPWLLFDEVTPADVNGDGKLDLLFASRGGDRLWVRTP